MARGVGAALAPMVIRRISQTMTLTMTIRSRRSARRRRESKERNTAANAIRMTITMTVTTVMTPTGMVVDTIVDMERPEAAMTTDSSGLTMVEDTSQPTEEAIHLVAMAGMRTLHLVDMAGVTDTLVTTAMEEEAANMTPMGQATAHMVKDPKAAMAVVAHMDEIRKVVTVVAATQTDMIMKTAMEAEARIAAEVAKTTVVGAHTASRPTAATEAVVVEVNLMVIAPINKAMAIAVKVATTGKLAEGGRMFERSLMAGTVAVASSRCLVDSAAVMAAAAMVASTMVAVVDMVAKAATVVRAATVVKAAMVAAPATVTIATGVATIVDTRM